MTIRSETSFASTLPGRYYYDPAIYALEQERIFSHMWVYVGRADALTQPGTYYTVSLGGESVIVVRDKELMLRACLNVCRHRGARLCLFFFSSRRRHTRCAEYA